MSKEKAERKYTSLACLECRKRKIKVSFILATITHPNSPGGYSATANGPAAPIVLCTWSNVPTVKIDEGKCTTLH